MSLSRSIIFSLRLIFLTTCLTGTGSDVDGYELMYRDSTALGMNGGSVIDTGGRMIGIHGQAAGTQGEW